MTNTGNGFELLGAAADETRLLVHRECGYSIPIPGHPVLGEPAPDSTPAYDVIALMADQPMELGFRLDSLPGGAEPAALANALALAYGLNRATEPPRVRRLDGAELAKGTTAGASCIYTVRDVAPDADSRTREQLEVVIRSHAVGLWALYYTVRYPVPGITPVNWAHYRAAVRGHQHWDPSAPLTAAPQLFPASAFASPTVSLDFTEEAWTEARAKAAELGSLTDDETTGLIKALLEFSNTNAPPTMGMPEFVIDLIPSRVRAELPEASADTLLRNFDQVKTQHDLRAWIWQCIWATGNRASRHN